MTLKLVSSPFLVEQEVRDLIAARRQLRERMKHIDAQLLGHGRTIADQRREPLRITIERLEKEFGA